MQTLKQNFICIGAQKAGTTTLADILAQHPDIYIPVVKETKFFLFDEDYKKGIDFYNKTYYNTYKGEKASGEFDPDYLLFPFTAKRIYDTLGKDIKIIVVLRNPADRAYSHYLMTKKKGLEKLDFLQAIEAEKQRKTNIKEQKIFAYIERGMYGEQLKQFMEIFPKQNFLILLFEEDIILNRENTIRHIQEFLQIPFHKLAVNIHSNEAGEMKNETVTNLLRKPNFAKQILKSILPSKEIRKNIRKFFIRKNLKQPTVSRLDFETKKMIIKKYFKNDILLTQQLTEKDLSNWLT
ncbi:MAG: sulfotransferase domain-containing protein [Fimbriimonadaceae bacterium]|nr:sulfotransferase domain-containing protein [Chitinophagales bacterium]